MNTRPLIWLGAALLAVLLLANTLFIVDQREQAVVLNLGQPVAVINPPGAFEPGLKIKAPFIESVLFLDKRNHLIADEVQQIGTIDHTPVYPREVIKRALEVSATAVILVHNHPSGDPTPSSADIQMTKAIVAIATIASDTL